MSTQPPSPRSPAQGPAPRGKPPPPAPSPARLEGEANHVALRVALGRGPGAAAPSRAALAGQARRELDDAPAAAPSGDGGMRADVGRALGRDLSRVRLHAGGDAARRTSAAGAHALAGGEDVWFAPGRYRPDLPLGRALIAHELAHSAQQGAAPRLAGTGEMEEELAITPAPAGALTLMACNGDDKDQAPPPVPTATPATPQPTAPPPPPPRITKVEDVRNLHAEEDLAALVAGGEGELAKRLRQRTEAIDGELATLKDKESDRAKKLKALKLKTLDQIIATPDTIISAAFRKDVIEAADKLKKKQLKKVAEEKKFHRYDEFFKKAAVTTALAGTGFTNADLKAFIAQESLDLVKEDTEGKIAGIAQLGPTEEKEAGGKAGDRLDPEKAILLAAKTIKIKSDRLDKLLSVPVTGDEHRRFVIAAYNAGETTIAEAQRLAIAMGRPGTKWSDLTDPGPGATPEARKQASPFYKAVQAKLPQVKPGDKYHETVEQYVPRIELRTTPP